MAELSSSKVYGDLTVTRNATISNNLTVGSGVYIPSYIYHTGDTNTYFGFNDTDEFTVRTGGIDRITIDSFGVTGISGILRADRLLSKTFNGSVAIQGNTEAGFEVVIGDNANDNTKMYGTLQVSDIASEASLDIDSGDGTTLYLNRVSTGKIFLGVGGGAVVIGGVSFDSNASLTVNDGLTVNGVISGYNLRIPTSEPTTLADGDIWVS